WPEAKPWPSPEPVAEADRRLAQRQDRDGRRSSLGGLVWLMSILAAMLVLRYVAPGMVEEIQYAMTRGQQRAKYDVAGQHLRSTNLNDLSLAYQMVSQRVAPSVVHIRTLRADPSGDDEQDKFRRLFGHLAPHNTQGQGSGVIVDEAGYLVTNYHVIHGSRDIDVQLADGRRMAAKVIGVDAPTDMAVLKIEG
ncbi:unnamed protein product, partial [marine sediment metagenome]